MKTKSLFFVLIAIALFTSCTDNDDINNADIRRLSSSTIVENTSHLFNNWFMSAHSADGPAMSIFYAADAGTNAWGGSGQSYYLSQEPRIVYNNAPSSPYQTSFGFYNSMYGIINSANDILYNTLEKNVKVYIDGIDKAEAINAYAYFIQGLGFGYLGLLYDQAFIVTETTDLKKAIPVSQYSELIIAALTSFDKAIEICETETFSLPNTWIPGIALNQETLAQLVNSFAARILAYSPRNKSENESIDWLKVYNYARNGIDFDLSPVSNDAEWYSSYHNYACYSGFGRADMRTVHMMDPDMPNKWPNIEVYVNSDTIGYGFLPDPKTTTEEAFDARLITDFQYLSSCNYFPERGLYYWSCYRFTRRDQYLSTGTEPMPEMYKVENDLLLAEAALKTNKLTEAATIINNGTRVTRAGLPAVSANETEIKDAIFHERMIELFCSGLGVEYFTMRKADKLQYGTILHFPIPGPQLETLMMDYYTFGPEVGTAGEDYSVGGW